MEKLITCKYCKAEISASAKVCPNCGGRNKKAFYKELEKTFENNPCNQGK